MEILAIMIACVALVVSITEAFVARKHNKLSVRPHLASTLSVGYETFVYSIENVGLGPAFIQSAIITKDKKAYDYGTMEGAVYLAADLGLSGFKGNKWNWTGVAKNSVIKAGEKINLIEIHKLPQNYDLDEYTDKLTFNLTVMYESLYKELIRGDL